VSHPAPPRGRGCPATHGGDTLRAASATASAAAPPAATSPARYHPAAAAAAAAPAPDGRSPASSPARPFQPARHRHGQTRRCRHGYGLGGAPSPLPLSPPSDSPPRHLAPTCRWRRRSRRASAARPLPPPATEAGVADGGRIAAARPDWQRSQRLPRPAVERDVVPRARPSPVATPPRVAEPWAGRTHPAA